MGLGRNRVFTPLTPPSPSPSSAFIKKLVLVLLVLAVLGVIAYLLTQGGQSGPASVQNIMDSVQEKLKAAGAAEPQAASPRRSGSSSSKGRLIYLIVTSNHEQYCQ